MKITAIDITELRGRREGPSVASFRHTDRAVPLDIYSRREGKPSLREVRTEEPQVEEVRELYLTIRTDEEIEGFYGPIDHSAAFVIREHLTALLIGEDPLAGTILWDKMVRSNRHGRTGFFMIGISAIDNALWDLRGKAAHLPVYRLLGGNARPVVDAYVSTIGRSHSEEALRADAIELKKRGFRRQKWFMARSPAEGLDGLEHNVALVRNLREALGDDVELMFDASMAWDLNYTIAWAERVREYRPKWIEEPFSPDKIEAWAMLASRAGIAVAGGEHLYTRWEMLRYLESGAISVLQPDPEWCGGVSALVKMCGLGELFDVPVIPHGHGLRAALHVVASQSPATCPMGEFVERTMLRRYYLEKEPPFPENGAFRLSERPGFGIVIDEEKVYARVPWQG